ncbi:MAG: alpha/beta hydrolase [Clostridiales bacterium]|nr:alpha/beta hydrolase [Clostridiales bacterium]
MEEKKQTIRLTAKEKKQERRHEKAAKPEKMAKAEKPEKEDRRLAPMMRALKAIHSVSTPGSMEPEELAKQRAAQEVLGRLAAPMIVLKKWETFQLKGMSAAWVLPDWPHDKHKVILYCHGGGYTSGNLGYSRPLASKLTNATGWETLCFEYRLAPEHPFPAAVDDARKAWDYLMYLGYGARDVMVAGDSDGGNLALVLCHQLKQAGRQLPGKLVLMSPWTDMTASGRSYTQRAEIDPTITMDYIRAVREVYADGKDLTSPFLSPLFGDFTGFPPTLIQVGTNEILYSDSIRLRERMLADNVHCQLEVWNDMWHVFQMFPTRKSALAMESIGKFLLD